MTIYEILLLACKTAQEGRKPQQNRKMSAQGKHRISRTGYPGQDNSIVPLGQDVQLKHSGK
jgi:hypothetical protein